MNNQKEASFCFINEYPSLIEGLFSLFGLSKSFLKKSKLPKNFLKKKIELKDEVSLSLDIINYRKINPEFTGHKKVELLYESKDFLFFSKPHKVHSHPLSYLESDNCLSALVGGDYQKFLQVNESEYDRGLLFRLDYETSGLLGYAKSNDIYNELRMNFHEIIKEKEYLALVKGKHPSKEKLIHYLISSGNKGRKVKCLESEEFGAKRAVIEVCLVSYNAELDQSLVRIYLGHGHRHQIRTQLAASGYAIVGDMLYGEEEQKEQRLYLHCHKYTFNFHGKELTITDPNFDLLPNFFDFNS